MQTKRLHKTVWTRFSPSFFLPFFQRETENFSWREGVFFPHFNLRSFVFRYLDLLPIFFKGVNLHEYNSKVNIGSWQTEKDPLYLFLPLSASLSLTHLVSLHSNFPLPGCWFSKEKVKDDERQRDGETYIPHHSFIFSCHPSLSSSLSIILSHLPFHPFFPVQKRQGCNFSILALIHVCTSHTCLES